MVEEYTWLVLGFIGLIIGLPSFINPELFINKSTPKIHPYFKVEIKKYLKIRGLIFSIIGLFLIVSGILVLLKII